MLIPLCFIFLLAVLISRTAKKFNTPITIPLLISLLVFIVFYFATRGIIRVQEDEIAVGILLGLLMYFAFTAAIYAGAFIWMKKKSPLPMDSSEKISNGIPRFRIFLGIREKYIDWKYPISLYLGFVGMVVFYLLQSSISEFPPEILQYASLVTVMVIGFHYLRNQHHLITALVVALVYGGLNFLIYSLFRKSEYLDFLVEFVFAFVFMISTILLLNRIKNPWIALGLGCYLARTLSILVIAIYFYIDSQIFLVMREIFLNVYLLRRLPDCIVFSAVVYGLYKIFKLNFNFLKFREITPQRSEKPPGISGKRKRGSDNLLDLVDVLADIYRRNPEGFGVDQGTKDKLRVKEIGQRFDQQGGMDLMRWAHKEFSIKCMHILGAARNLEIMWDGIGNWRG